MNNDDVDIIFQKLHNYVEYIDLMLQESYMIIVIIRLMIIKQNQTRVSFTLILFIRNVIK